MHNNERWAEVPGYEGFYLISDQGRLRRVATHKGRPKDKLITPHVKSHGYLDYWLWADGSPKRIAAHRLVALAFLGEIPERMQVNHKNGNKHDNRLVNLEIVTPSENMAHSFRVLGRASPNNPTFGTNNGSSKLDDDKVREIRSLRLKGEHQHVIAKKFGVSQRTISLIDRRELWGHVED